VEAFNNDAIAGLASREVREHGKGLCGLNSGRIWHAPATISSHGGVDGLSIIHGPD